MVRSDKEASHPGCISASHIKFPEQDQDPTADLNVQAFTYNEWMNEWMKSL